MAPFSKTPPSEPPLIILWSTPRSASTAFEKAMMQHPGVMVIHEPFTDCYYFGNERCSARYGNYSGGKVFNKKGAYAAIGPKNSDKVRFVKELAFQARPYVSDEFLKSATNLFLINNPDAVYNSLSNIKPDFTEDEFGYTELYTLYERTCQIIGHRPALYTTEEFRNDPATILRQVCSFANIDFIPTMLHWSPGPIRKWEPHEVLSQSKWHRTTEQSNGILPYQKPVPLAINSSNKTPMIEAAWRIFTTLTKTVTQEAQGTITSDNGKTI